MQVRDLITELQKFDPSAEVEVHSTLKLESDMTAEIDSVEIDSDRFRVLIKAQ